MSCAFVKFSFYHSGHDLSILAMHNFKRTPLVLEFVATARTLLNGLQPSSGFLFPRRVQPALRESGVSSHDSHQLTQIFPHGNPAWEYGRYLEDTTYTTMFLLMMTAGSSSNGLLPHTVCYLFRIKIDSSIGCTSCANLIPRATVFLIDYATSSVELTFPPANARNVPPDASRYWSISSSLLLILPTIEIA